MPLDPHHLPVVVQFFTSPAWANLRELIEANVPAYPPLAADALTTTSQCRRREGYELCLKTLLREAGITPIPVDKKEPRQSTGDPMKDAMQELLDNGEFVDTARD